MPQQLMPWEDPPAPASRSKEAMPWEDAVPSVTSRVVRYDMPEPPAAPKIAALQPDAPAPPGFGQRVYEQTLQGPVELVKGLWNDPRRTLMQTIANMTATQIQGVQNPMRIQAASPVTPIIEDVRSGNLSGAAGGVTGLGLTLVTPKVLSKVPGAAKVTGAGVRAAAPDVAIGTAKVGAGYAMEHILPGAGYLKYAVELPTAYSGAKQIGRGLKKGVAASREALKARAQAAAEALAAERAAAQPAPIPLIPEERRLTSPPDTSYVRAVPAEPLPPSRQLAAPGRPAVITPEPEAPADTSFVRAAPADLPEVLSPTLRKNQAAATAAEQLREEMVKSGTITPEEPTPITRQSGAEKIVEARNAKAERFVEPFQRFEFSTKDVKDFGPSEWEVFAKAIGEDVPSPDTIAQIVLRMGKRK